MWEATTICPRPLQVDLRPFDRESGVRVTCDMAYLCANFSFPRPLCSRLRPDVCDRQTDVRHASALNAPYPRGGGIITFQISKGKNYSRGGLTVDFPWVTLTLTLVPAIRHTVVHHSSTSTYVPNFIEIGRKFFWKSPLRFWSSSESRDTKTRTNIKNPARSNLDIVL